MADPGEIAAKQVQKQWPKFGTIRKACTYKEVANGTYNPATGLSSDNTPISETPIYVIFDNFSFTSKMSPVQEDDEEGAVYTDKKAMFPRLDLVPIPKPGDFITNTSTGEVWRVMGLQADPVPALYELHVRLWA